MDNLQDRIRSTNCISNHDKPPLHLIYGTLPSYLNSQNFILHRICLMDGKSQDTIETRLYCITFLLIDGYEDCNWSRIWVMGKVVNMLITHKNKTKKYVYDETVKDVQGSPMQNNQYDLQLAPM